MAISITEDFIYPILLNSTNRSLLSFVRENVDLLFIVVPHYLNYHTYKYKATLDNKCKYNYTSINNIKKR